MSGQKKIEEIMGSVILGVSEIRKERLTFYENMQKIYLSLI